MYYSYFLKFFMTNSSFNHFKKQLNRNCINDDFWCMKFDMNAYTSSSLSFFFQKNSVFPFCFKQANNKCEVKIADDISPHSLNSTRSFSHSCHFFFTSCTYTSASFFFTISFTSFCQGFHSKNYAIPSWLEKLYGSKCLTRGFHKQKM
jgi:hypothetical protein